MSRRIIFFLVSMLIIVMVALGFQYARLDRVRPPHTPTRSPQGQMLNQGRPAQSRGPQYAADQVLVKFRPDISEDFVLATIAAYRAKQLKRIPRVGIYQLQIPEDMTVEEMLALLRQNPDVEHASPNHIARMTATPNDALFRYQYALNNTGQNIGIPGSPSGKDRADIKATEGWEETKGDEDVVIAFIDTGIDLLHPELRDKAISSGRDFVNDDFDATDDNGHGTHVAGIAAAATNNSEGVAGVSWNCKILPVKALDEDGSGFYSWIIEGIIWAADNGADVISLSLGGDTSDQDMAAALRYAFQKDIVIAAAAGNDSDAVLYPAAYDEYVIAVAGTDFNDERVEYSNSGPEIDVAAPAERVLSCVPTWYFGPDSFPYAFGFGTSMAVPHVAGLAALIKSIKPWLTSEEIMNVIRFTADDINDAEHPGFDEFIGYGRINMEKALVPIKITR